MKLAIVCTHPIQYYAPWFRYLVENKICNLHVFYLWDFGVRAQEDPGFQQEISWDQPLLEGYEHSFVSNKSLSPGTSRFSGLRNPQLPRFLESYAPDAVLCLGYRFLPFMSLLIDKKYPLMLRGDSHFLAGYSPNSLPHMIRRALLSRFDAYLAVGKANADYYLKHSIAAEKIFLSPHAVDNERFVEASSILDQSDCKNWRVEHSISPDDYLFLFVGKFEEKKRPVELLEAFLAAKVPKASLAFVGSGPLEEKLREQSARSSQVHILPFHNQGQMPLVYKSADCLVLPSKGAYETWGLCVNEALCCGTPAIVSSVVGCGPDLADDLQLIRSFPVNDLACFQELLLKAQKESISLDPESDQYKNFLLRYSYKNASSGLRSAMEYLLG